MPSYLDLWYHQLHIDINFLLPRSVQSACSVKYVIPYLVDSTHQVKLTLCVMLWWDVTKPENFLLPLLLLSPFLTSSPFKNAQYRTWIDVRLNNFNLTQRVGSGSQEKVSSFQFCYITTWQYTYVLQLPNLDLHILHKNIQIQIQIPFWHSFLRCLGKNMGMHLFP